ncbi:peptidylprolyl isomerase [Novacetimonas hansenii]|uniref:Parvulin-like PPIase n=2 Tax=Novacetimonas hansenii TaxID=436 RepID=A0ABQ0SBL3_NOVHA|nr:peptidylprolyl isomerase [Novacetimonas hansenii]EFG83639.1 peptidyl-prolyl cis-trans isomerase [Novacetimonas hansenii ATCC 23769]MBL7237766.1 peptidylprolyl isomerase [Novacetimonas hansenii]QOF96046.1 peptidylprolyl isomerase [Novacetimonas hansenii]GAN82845.1 peptidyl-prolyl cis-trans isomerase [Novacetimonas hansenii JCM 7643]GBQ62324.1 peptidyl-prolyl cis-trans isomerase [Novacetimonas hansenii NRIC 0243]
MRWFSATPGSAPSRRPARQARRLARLAGAGLMSAAMAVTASDHAHAARHKATAEAADTGPQTEDSIVAIVNGSVLTKRDVDTRGRLFALSSGLDVSKDVMVRLRPQIVRQLIDERLRMEAMLERHINVPVAQIAAAISGIEQRNGMPENSLRNRLAQDSISLTTLIDQIRVQVGWSQVLRMETGSRGRITATEIQQRTDALKREDGKPQYMISEIFVPVEDPHHPETELKFTETIIQELREGAPFPIVAAQFSQSQSALEGGLLGWTQEDSLDPEVVEVARKMPDGAISNPIRVAGGYVIATVNNRRTVGHEMATILNIHQAFLPFDQPLNPQDPSDQQKQTLQQASDLAGKVKSCDEMETLNKKFGEKHPTDPGELRVDRLNPQMREVLEHLQPGQASHPLVSMDGIALIMVCKREERNVALQTPSEIADQLLNERVEQTSRQLDRDLHRRAVIDMRSKS